MTRKLLAILTLCALSSITSAAVLSTPSVSYSLFNVTPVTVYNVSNASDVAFKDGYTGNGLSKPTGTYYSPGLTNDLIYVWLFNGDGSTSITSIVKRTLNATLLAASQTNDTTESFVIGSDITTPKTIPYNWYDVASGPGYVALLVQYTDTYDQVALVLIEGKSTTISTVLITNNADSTVHFKVSSIWYEDGYFYLLYYSYTSGTVRRLSEDRELQSTACGAWLQAVAANTTNTLYSTPQYVVNFNCGSNYNNIVAGPSNWTNSSHIYIAYADPSSLSVKSVVVRRRDGVVVDKRVLVGNTNGYSYFPVGIIGSNYTIGTIVAVAYTDGTSTSHSLSVYYNETTSPAKIGLSCPDSMTPVEVVGINYGAGFLVHGYHSSYTDYMYQVMTYNYDGTVSSYANNLGFITGPVNYFVDANYSIWYGYTILGSDSYTHAGLLGMLGGPETTSSSRSLIAPVLASLVAIISLLLI